MPQVKPDPKYFLAAVETARDAGIARILVPTSILLLVLDDLVTQRRNVAMYEARVEDLKRIIGSKSPKWDDLVDEITRGQKARADLAKPRGPREVLVNGSTLAVLSTGETVEVGDVQLVPGKSLAEWLRREKSEAAEKAVASSSSRTIYVGADALRALEAGETLDHEGVTLKPAANLASGFRDMKCAAVRSALAADKALREAQTDTWTITSTPPAPAAAKVTLTGTDGEPIELAAEDIVRVEDHRGKPGTSGTRISALVRTISGGAWFVRESCHEVRARVQAALLRAASVEAREKVQARERQKRVELDTARGKATLTLAKDGMELVVPASDVLRVRAPKPTDSPADDTRSIVTIRGIGDRQVRETPEEVERRVRAAGGCVAEPSGAEWIPVRETIDEVRSRIAEATTRAA